MKRRRGLALVVDGEEGVGARVAAALAARFDDVACASDAAAAVEALLAAEQVGWILVDLGLPDAARLAEAALLLIPTPVVVVSGDGDVDPALALALGRSGVAALVHRPFDVDELMAVFEAAEARPPPEIVPWVAPWVGAVDLFTLEDRVRQAAVLQALGRSGESRSGAARLLRAPRPVVQRAAPPRISSDPPENS